MMMLGVAGDGVKNRAGVWLGMRLGIRMRMGISILR